MNKWIATIDQLPEPHKIVLAAYYFGNNNWIYEILKFDPYPNYYWEWYRTDEKPQYSAPDFWEYIEQPTL